MVLPQAHRSLHRFVMMQLQLHIQLHILPWDQIEGFAEQQTLANAGATCQGLNGIITQILDTEYMLRAAACMEEINELIENGWRPDTRTIMFGTVRAEEVDAVPHSPIGTQGFLATQVDSSEDSSPWTHYPSEPSTPKEIPDENEYEIIPEDIHDRCKCGRLWQDVL